MVNLVELRRHLHAEPELAFKEAATADRLKTELESCNFRVVAGVAGTGLIAEQGEGGGPFVAVRSDMDALPINEMNNVSYRSKRSGVMHACGHDAHMACVVGVADLLSQSGTTGNVRIIMQPGEEVADYNERGSVKMIEAGAMKDVSVILGLHVDGTMPTGHVGVITQPTHAFSCQFELTNGQDLDGNIMQSGARLANALMTVAEEVRGLKAQLDLSEIRVRNFPPSRGLLVTGSITYPEAEAANRALEFVRAAATKVLGANQFELNAQMDEEVLARHEQAIETLYEAACGAVGESKVVRVTRKTWAGNFADFTRHAPGAFLLLGAELRGDRRIQHTATFDIDEEALPIGAQVIADAVKKLCAAV